MRSPEQKTRRNTDMEEVREEVREEEGTYNIYLIKEI